MPRRQDHPGHRTRRTRQQTPTHAGKRQRWLNGGLLAVAAALGLALLARGLSAGPRLQARARAAEAAADWQAAARAWNAFNSSSHRASSDSLLREARSHLACHQARPATAALVRTCQLEPADPRPWLLRLELLRLEDRPLDAMRVGAQALAAVKSSDAPTILKGITLALLAEVPQTEARAALSQRIQTDPADLDAQAAYLRLVAFNPRADDPSRPDRIATLRRLLQANPDHSGLREALVTELADGGEPELGLAALEAWPSTERDARYLRLRGRWALQYENQPSAAVPLLRQALAELPHDGPTRYRLARALKLTGQVEEARTEADRLARIREALEPPRLTRRLQSSLANPADPKARSDLARLCHQIGMEKLARAWDPGVRL